MNLVLMGQRRQTVGTSYDRESDRIDVYKVITETIQGGYDSGKY